MKYMLLIYDNEQAWKKLSEAEQSKVYADYGQFTQEITSNGNFLAGAQLHPIATASTVRVRDGKELVTDGPFAQTHEQLGGYYPIAAKTLRAARRNRA